MLPYAVWKSHFYRATLDAGHPFLKFNRGTEISVYEQFTAKNRESRHFFVYFHGYVDKIVKTE